MRGRAAAAVSRPARAKAAGVPCRVLTSPSTIAAVAPWPRTRWPWPPPRARGRPVAATSSGPGRPSRGSNWCSIRWHPRVHGWKRSASSGAQPAGSAGSRPVQPACATGHVRLRAGVRVGRATRGRRGGDHGDDQRGTAALLGRGPTRVPLLSEVASGGRVTAGAQVVDRGKPPTSSRWNRLSPAGCDSRARLMHDSCAQRWRSAAGLRPRRRRQGVSLTASRGSGGVFALPRDGRLSMGGCARAGGQARPHGGRPVRREESGHGR